MDPSTAMRGFENYWRHWNLVNEWRQRHEAAYLSAQNEIMSAYNIPKPTFTVANDSPMKPMNHNVYKSYEYDSGNNLEAINDSLENPVDESKQMLHNGIDDCNDSSDDEELELEFVINEDMIAFFEQSMRHKLELKKQRESVSRFNSTQSDLLNQIVDDEGSKKKNGNSKRSAPVLEKVPVPSVGVDDQRRTREMALLYGEAAPKICGMEIAIQLWFNRLCDSQKPVYWPCIPFRP